VLRARGEDGRQKTGSEKYLGDRPFLAGIRAQRQLIEHGTNIGLGAGGERLADFGKSGKTMAKSDGVTTCRCFEEESVG
jgi:hypothetical protein